MSENELSVKEIEEKVAEAEAQRVSTETKVRAHQESPIVGPSDLDLIMVYIQKLEPLQERLKQLTDEVNDAKEFLEKAKAARESAANRAPEILTEKFEELELVLDHKIETLDGQVEDFTAQLTDLQTQFKIFAAKYGQILDKIDKTTDQEIATLKKLDHVLDQYV